MPGVYRHPPRPTPHAGVRDLSWRQPAFNPLLPNNSIQGVIYSGSGLSLQTGVSPAVKIGDTFQTSNTSPNNFAVQVNSDGTIDVFSGGNTSRQSIQYKLFRRITGTYDGPAIVWINEVAPIWNSAVVLPSFSSGPIIVGAAITPVVLQSATYAVSPPGDTLIFAVASGSLPPGLSLASGQIVGIPTTAGTSFFTLSATDITGTSTISLACSISVSQQLVPNVVGQTLANALTALNNAGYTNVIENTAYSALIPPGFVAIQSPFGGTSAPVGILIKLSLSLGPYVPPPLTGPGTITSPRVWGRTNNGVPPYQWVAVTPDANGQSSYLNITWLIQVLKLNLGESPLYANYGIPAQQSVITQIFPDYYVQQVQQQFSQYFASLQITKVVPNSSPVYNVAITTFEGTIFNEDIAV